MFKNTVSATLLLLCLGFTGVSLAADDPTLHQIYQAAESGRLDEAQAMMQKVLQDHPNSAKAHYVEAELFAKQGRMTNAAAELSRAEQIAPDLSFAKPAAVQTLKARIAGRATLPTQSYAAAPQSAGTPWTMILLGGGIIVSIIYFARALTRRNTPSYIPGLPGNPGNGAGPNYNGSTMPPAGSPGMGSNLLGGLATGVAMGAGVVAGEALVHRLMDGDHANDPSLARRDAYTAPQDNLGGDDFGVNDSSSWDDSSGDSNDGGGDWG